MLIALISGIYYTTIPEYRVYKIFSSDGADFRETDLHVIVYKPWNVKNTVKKGVEQYNKMNGTPDRLTIWLYHNKHDVDSGKEFYKAVFEYRKNEVTEPPGVWEEQYRIEPF